MADDAPSRPSAPWRVHPIVWVLIALAGAAALHFLAVPPVLNHTAIHALEMAAIQQIETIQAAQTQYYSQFGRFATKLEELGPTRANLIPADLAKGIKTGYQFTLVGRATGYSINAKPVIFDTKGRRTFFSDQSNVIRENSGQEPATINSPEIK